MNLIKKHHRIISLTVMTVLLTGCSQGHSPFIPMLGAYFPIGCYVHLLAY
ncbi:hypothetical protein I3679_008060 [Proteus mirabilis]|uniref:Lipoprotein n=1 Tax=Proteus mirabilis TaxID=584 RepID=A0ABD5LRZ9_PROMI